MKKLLIKSVLLSVVLMVTATVNVHAEAWRGVNINSLTDNSEVYMYNVDTGKFLYIGGAWGTHGELLYSDFGLKFKMRKISYNNEYRYVFTSDVYTQGSGSTTGKFFGMMRNNSVRSANGITVDKQETYIQNSLYCYSRFKVERVSGETGDIYTYLLSLCPHENFNQVPNATYYLSVAEDGLGVEEQEARNKAGRWRFVPISEIDAAVRNAALSVDAFNGMNLDITYKIDNQGFNRNNDNDWTPSGATYHHYDLIQKNGKWVADDDYYHLSDQDSYGKYYYGLMSSANPGGTISRSFTAPATGWYKVLCQGVSKSGNGYAYAKVGSNVVKVPLNVVDNNEYTHNAILNSDNRVKLGIDFYDNRYPVEVYVHANVGETIELGIMQAAAYIPSEDLTAFDDFQIKFLGDIFVLDEDYTERTVEYTTGTTSENGATVILHRTFSKKDDGSYYWNTLTLPINLTGAQVKSAFGDGVKLAVASGLDQSDPYVIKFQSVDADNGIQAGQFYLIQPAKEPATPAGQTINFINKNIKGPLYTLGRRDVNPISADLFKDDGWNAPSHNSIRYHGTYLKLENGVPARSYVFSKGDMYHTKTAQTIKGFRFWIQDEEAAQGSSAKPFVLSISGVEDQQEAGQIITTISEVETVTSDNAAVYSLSGQFLGKGKQLLNSLPKGVYVVNNKKYMVK